MWIWILYTCVYSTIATYLQANVWNGNSPPTCQPNEWRTAKQQQISGFNFKVHNRWLLFHPKQLGTFQMNAHIASQPIWIVSKTSHPTINWKKLNKNLWQLFYYYSFIRLSIFVYGPSLCTKSFFIMRAFTANVRKLITEIKSNAPKRKRRISVGLRNGEKKKKKKTSQFQST